MERIGVENVDLNRLTIDGSIRVQKSIDPWETRRLVLQERLTQIESALGHIISVYPIGEATVQVIYRERE
jgi:hypothetical protein